MPDTGDSYTLNEVKDPDATQFDPPSKRTLTLTHTDGLLGTFSYVTGGDEEPWTGTFKMQDGEMTTWITLTFENGPTAEKQFETMIDTNGMWFENLENYIARTSEAKAGDAAPAPPDEPMPPTATRLPEDDAAPGAPPPPPEDGQPPTQTILNDDTGPSAPPPPPEVATQVPVKTLLDEPPLASNDVGLPSNDIPTTSKQPLPLVPSNDARREPMEQVLIVNSEVSTFAEPSAEKPKLEFGPGYARVPTQTLMDDTKEKGMAKASHQLTGALCCIWIPMLFIMPAGSVLDECPSGSFKAWLMVYGLVPMSIGILTVFGLAICANIGSRNLFKLGMRIQVGGPLLSSVLLIWGWIAWAGTNQEDCVDSDAAINPRGLALAFLIIGSVCMPGLACLSIKQCADPNRVPMAGVEGSTGFAAARE